MIFKRSQPKRSETYYLVNPVKPTVTDTLWLDDAIDFALLYFGNVFRTEAEAEAHIPEIHEKYRKIREGKRFEWEE